MRGLQTSQQFYANQTVVWTATAGSITTGGLYTPPNVTGAYSITARNFANETTVVPVAVTGDFPRYYSYRIPRRFTKKVLIWEPERGADQTREKSGKRAFYDLKGTENSRAQYEEVEVFWNAHFPAKKFYLYDVVLERDRFFKFDSELKVEDESFDRISWSVAIKEAWPFGD